MQNLENLFSAETEMALLGSLLINPDAIETVSFLQASDFHIKANGWIYEALLNLHHGGQAIDILTMGNELDRNRRLAQCGGAAHLTELMAYVPSALHATTYAEEIVDLSVRRQILQALSGIAKEVHSSRGVDEVVANAGQAINGAYRSRGEFQPTSQVAGATYDTVKYWHENPQKDGVRGVRTTLDVLDKATGGLNANELTILAARPRVGKSSLMGWIGMRVAEQGHRVLISSLEMTAEQIVMRLACGLSEISLQRLKRGGLSTAERDKIKGAIKHISGLDNLWISDTTGLTSTALRAEAASLGNPELVMVDHISLMGDVDDREVRRLGKITWNLKQLAKQGECSVIALCQLSRKSEYRTDKRPQLADLRDSGEIEQNADNVWGLYREGLNGDGGPPSNVLEVHCLKNRNGPSNYLAKVFFNPATMRMGNLARANT